VPIEKLFRAKIFNADADMRIRIVQNTISTHPWSSGKKQSKITWWGEDGSIESDTCEHLTREMFDEMFHEEDKIIVAVGLRKSDKDGSIRSDSFDGFEDNRAEGALYIEIEDEKDREKAKKILEEDAALLNAYINGVVYNVLVEEKCSNPKCSSWHIIDTSGDYVWAGNQDGADERFWNSILPFLNEHLGPEQIKAIRESFSMAEE